MRTLVATVLSVFTIVILVEASLQACRVCIECVCVPSVFAYISGLCVCACVRNLFIVTVEHEAISQTDRPFNDYGTVRCFLVIYFLPSKSPNCRVEKRKRGA